MKQVSGFTLIEFTAVILILAILTAAAFARLPHARLNLTAQAEQLVSDIRYVQSLAMTQGARHCIAFTSSQTYELRKTVTTTCDTNVTFPGNTGSTITLAKNIAFASATPVTYEFNGKGIPYTASPNDPLASEAAITLSSEDGSRSVRIVPETGRVYAQ